MKYYKRINIVRRRVCITDYIKPILCLMLGIMLRLDGKSIIHGLLIGGTLALLPWIIARVVTDWRKGYREVKKSTNEQNDNR